MLVMLSKLRHNIFSIIQGIKMDVLSPDLLWIDGKCYRLPELDSLNSIRDYLSIDKIEETEIEEAFDDEEKCFQDTDDTYELEELIETLPDNRYKLCLSIPQTFWSKIIGAKGVTKKRIESDTKTIIMVPRPTEHGDIVVKGISKRGIILAKKNIDVIVSSARQKLVFTHFISVPMNGEEIKRNFLYFKNEVLKEFCTDRGVDESIFQNPNKLHLTIGLLVLTDQNERNLAEKMLHEVYEKTIRSLIANKQNVIIEIKGIEYMNDDPSEVDILYGKIATDEELLQKIADSILHCFSDKIVKSENSGHVKFHVTLMNTLFREEEIEEVNEEVESFKRNKWSKKTRRTFNAANIMQKFQGFYFGQQELKSLHLSVRFSTDKSGYYKSSCTLNF